MRYLDLAQQHHHHNEPSEYGPTASGQPCTCGSACRIRVKGCNWWVNGTGYSMRFTAVQWRYSLPNPCESLWNYVHATPPRVWPNRVRRQWKPTSVREAKEAALHKILQSFIIVQENMLTSNKMDSTHLIQLFLIMHTLQNRQWPIFLARSIQKQRVLVDERSEKNHSNDTSMYYFQALFSRVECNRLCVKDCNTQK